jgi:hypothetical protein
MNGVDALPEARHFASAKARFSPRSSARTTPG